MVLREHPWQYCALECWPITTDLMGLSVYHWQCCGDNFTIIAHAPQQKPSNDKHLIKGAVLSLIKAPALVNF